MRSRIDGEFFGWDFDRFYLLENGRAFQQVGGLYSYRYIYRPVAIVENGELFVEGMDGSAPVRSVDVIHSKISGEFTGWDGNTKFELTNGQIWQQSRYSYKYKYLYRPNVHVFDGCVLRVEGMEEQVEVRRIR